jgi:uncharacterized protein (DUF2147 family)
MTPTPRVQGAMGTCLAKLVIVAAMAGTVAFSVRAAEPSAVGLWEQVDDESGKAESWFRISERNGVYEGTIVKIFFRPGDDENWTCDKCEGADHGKPVLGLTLIKGMRRNGSDYEDGTIMDPRNGKVYRAVMKLHPDGQRLDVRGYLTFVWLGRTQTWNRLPDNALGPAPSARAPAKKK